MNQVKDNDAGLVSLVTDKLEVLQREVHEQGTIIGKIRMKNDLLSKKVKEKKKELSRLKSFYKLQQEKGAAPQPFYYLDRQSLLTSLLWLFLFSFFSLILSFLFIKPITETNSGSSTKGVTLLLSRLNYILQRLLE